MSASAVATSVGPVDAAEAGRTEPQEDSQVPEVTLWELVWAVAEVADDEREVVATVAHMLNSGAVRVVGDIRDRRIRFAS
jgi:hypothetical protein